MLKQRLQHKLLQKLSPQQIQMIKLLEIPAIQLEQRIKKELEENPVLEEGNEEPFAEQEEAKEEQGDQVYPHQTYSLIPHLNQDYPHIHTGTHLPGSSENYRAASLTVQHVRWQHSVPVPDTGFQ